MPERTRTNSRDVLTMLVWAVVVMAGVLSSSVVFTRLSSATDPAPASESQQARRTLETITGEQGTILAVVTDTQAEQLAARLRLVPGVQRVRTSADDQLPRPNGEGTTLAIALQTGLDDRAANATIDAVRHEFAALPTGKVIAGGYPLLDRDLSLAAKADLARAELIALPIVLILLGLALRSALGSLLGLSLVATTVTGALALLLGISTVTQVSTFAVNVVTMFGIGLAVDYGLLIVNRFRRERAYAPTLADAVIATMATSGRTVAVSGLTVAVALAGLLAFNEPVVRSMAYGGIGAVAVAVASALTLMPALLRRFGHRIPPARTQSPSTWFARMAAVVQRRPVFIAAVSLAILVVLALPLSGLALQGVDERALPASSSIRQDSQQLEQRLPVLTHASITIVASASPTTPDVDSYISRVRELPHVTSATVRPEVSANVTVIDVSVDGPAGGGDAIGTVNDIRSLRPGFDAKVTGLTARFNDFIDGLTGRAPYALALIALATFLVLLIVTGGILVAAKAVLMNLASLAASLGALVWFFQQGHLTAPLQFTPTGGVSLVIVVLTAAFAFGLSTDYEVFLLSAVMDERHSGAETNHAVAAALARTGNIITTAAVLMIVVFVGFASSDVLIITQLGLGLAVAVLLDATIVRLALTPALMTMFGKYNWLGPQWTRQLSRGLWRTHA